MSTAIFTDFADADLGEAGVTLDHLAVAIQVWSWTNGGRQTVAEAADVFNVRIEDAYRALAASDWIVLIPDEMHPGDLGRMTIEYDGE